MESKALRFGLCGRLWTAVDTAWRSTDQEVGGSSPSGCTNETSANTGASPLDGLVDLLTFGSHSREPSVVGSTIRPTNHLVFQADASAPRWGEREIAVHSAAGQTQGDVETDDTGGHPQSPPSLLHDFCPFDQPAPVCQEPNCWRCVGDVVVGRDGQIEDFAFASSLSEQATQRGRSRGREPHRLRRSA